MKLPLNNILARLSKREKTVFYISVFLVGLVFIDRFVLSPLLVKISELDDQIKFEEETIRKSLTILSQGKKIKQEKDKYSPYLVERQSPEKEVIVFLQEIENLAKESSISLLDIKSSSEKKTGVAKQYFVDLNFEAEMKQVFVFLYAIAKEKKLFLVETYNIRPRTGKGESEEEEEKTSIVTCSVTVSKTIVPK